jgi:triosephosphate isomerase
MRPLIVANWKMNPSTLKGAKLLFNSVKRGVKNIKNVEVVICPPFIYLPNIIKNQCRVLISGKVKLGAQDCFWEEKGAFSGEISLTMLKNIGCQYVIIGHSERRKYLRETDEMINKKIKAAISAKLKPILCIGETEQERKKSKTFQVLKNQLKKALINSSTHQPINLAIAYEPIWAISTTRGATADTPADAAEGANYIRKILTELFDKTSIQKIKVLYGGSVDSKNVRSFVYEAKMNGVLVGAASLNPKEFIKLVKNVSKS